MKVNASGGTPERIASRDVKMDAGNLSWPHFLPDGRTLLVTAGQGLIAQGTSIIVMLSLDTGEWTSIGPVAGEFVEPTHRPSLGAVKKVSCGGEVRACTSGVRGDPSSVLGGVFRAVKCVGAYFATAP